MSYEQLAEHAAKLEQSAAVMDMRQRGFMYVDGELRDSHMTDAQVKEAYEITAGRFAGVAEMFAPFLNMPDPLAFSPVAAQLAEVASTLNTGQASITGGSNILNNLALGKMDDVKGLVQDWQGSAAINFRDNFLSTWEPITNNQFGLVIALKGAIEAERGLWTEARKSVDDIAHKAQIAMDAILDCNVKDMMFLITVAGSIFAVGGAVATGGLAIALTVVGEVASSGGAFPVQDPEKKEYAAKNVPGVISGVQAGLNKLAQDIIATENRIRDAVNEAITVLGANHSKVVAPRPMLADVTSSTVRDPGVGLGTAMG